MSHERIERFLLGTLAPSTQQRYDQALDFLRARLACDEDFDWVGATESERDWWLADWIVAGYDEGLNRQHFAAVLSALGRVDPRGRYNVAWRCIDGWALRLPTRQAPAAWPELVMAMVALAGALGRSEIALPILLCYAGLLRAREALMVRRNAIFFGDKEVSVVLGRTKRGIDQRVVLQSPLLLAWLRSFMAAAPSDAHERVFDVGYSTFLSWVRRLSEWLGAGSLGLTTHSLRRSGATQLAALNVPMSNILLYGRWASDRAAREYIRRGEVAVLRGSGAVPRSAQRMMCRWAVACGVMPHLWQAFASVQPPPRVVTDELLEHLLRVCEVGLVVA